jgi:hypothetical protein
MIFFRPRMGDWRILMRNASMLSLVFAAAMTVASCSSAQRGETTQHLIGTVTQRTYQAVLTYEGKSWTLAPKYVQKRQFEASCGGGETTTLPNGKITAVTCEKTTEYSPPMRCADGPILPSASVPTAAVIRFITRPFSVLLYTFNLNGNSAETLASLKHPRRFGTAQGRVAVPLQIRIPLTNATLVNMEIAATSRAVDILKPLSHAVTKGLYDLSYTYTFCVQRSNRS